MAELRARLRGGFALWLALGLGWGVAQAAPIARRPASEEIKVVALRRSMALQKVPASVQRLSGGTLRAFGAATLAEAAPLVANFAIDENFRAGVPYLSMRGIPTAAGGESPVQVLIDGVQAPGLDFINLDLVDVQDIEILRGPQGALYGRGAIAGAVLINTVQPTDRLRGSAMLDYGNGQTIRVATTVSGPVVPQLVWGKISYQYKGSKGLIEDIGLHRPGDSYHENNVALELVARPSAETTVTAELSHLRGIDGASLQNIVPVGGIYDFSRYQPDRNLATNDHRRTDRYVLKLDQAIALGAVSSVSQYAVARSDVVGDGDFTPAPVAVQNNAVAVRAVNQDVRLSSRAGGRVGWMVGGFFQYRATHDFLDVFREEPGVLPPGPPFALSNEHATSLAYAGYAQGNLALPYRLSLSAGLRYDVDRRRDEAAGAAGSIVHANYGALQPSATVSEQFTPRLMGYATMGRGFRSGGFNALQDTENFPALVRRAYPAETVLNIEGGFKASLWGDRLTANGSVFHARYHDEQFYFVNVSPPSRDIITLRDVAITGGELELGFRPVPAVTLSGVLGVALSRIDSSDGPLGDRGKHSPNANQYNFAVTASYRPRITDTVNGLVRVDGTELGPIYFDPANRDSFHASFYLDARLGLERGGYGLFVWGRNLTDERYATIFSPDAFGAGLSGRLDNLPTSYGVEMTGSF